MPNQNSTQDPTKGNTGQVVNPPAGASTDHSVFSPQDLPPLPPDFQSVTATPVASSVPDVSSQPTPPSASSTEAIVKTDQPADSSSGSAAPPDFPSVISSKPKKKFGGGKVVATILGILLLIGGVGTGVYLTQQQQIFQPQAVKTNPNDIGNPGQRIAAGGGNGGSGGNNPDIVNQQAGSYNAVGSANYSKVDYGVTGSTGKTCSDIGDPATRQQCFKDHPVGNADDTKPCGTAANPLGAVSADNKTCVEPGIGCNGITGSDCSQPHWTTCADIGGTGNSSCLKVVSSATGGGTNTATESPVATATPGPTASCVNVVAYSSTWVALTSANLSALAPGTVVNFCVAGSADSGAFDKADFKINSTLEPETTTHRPGSTDFCQSYTILSTDTTVNVKAKIHHATLGWEGESI